MVAILASQLIGGSSLLLLVVFLFVGPFEVVDLGLSTTHALVWDGALSLVFFLQHSVMVRGWFRARLATVIETAYHGAMYSITSGVVLLALVALWQPTPLIASSPAPFRWMLYAVCAAGIAGFAWGVRALGSFDGFGTRPLRASISGRTVAEVPFTVRGPYRWVRHPLYTSVLVLLWSAPDLTADRLLLNLSWTVWIVIGSKLEERDLVTTFGEPYREYQRRVSMLLPLRRPWSAEPRSR